MAIIRLLIDIKHLINTVSETEYVESLKMRRTGKYPFCQPLFAPEFSFRFRTPPCRNPAPEVREPHLVCRHSLAQPGTSAIRDPSRGRSTIIVIYNMFGPLDPNILSISYNTFGATGRAGPADRDLLLPRGVPAEDDLVEDLAVEPEEAHFLRVGHHLAGGAAIAPSTHRARRRERIPRAPLFKN